MKAHLIVAQNSLDVVSTYFIKRGFQVFDRSDPSANGQDLTVAKSGRTFRVEVKTATKSTRSHRVKPVKPLRRQDDLIAIVIGDSVIVQPMRDHLACCGKDGTRHITELIRLLDFDAI